MDIKLVFNVSLAPALFTGVTRYQSMLALVTEPDEYAPFRSIRVSHLPAVIRRPIDWILQGKRVVDASGDFRAYVRKTLGVQDVDQDWVETLKRRYVALVAPL